MKNRIPLLFKLLIPLVVLESVLLLLLIALFHHEQTNWMHQTARQRAELLAQALEQRAQTTTTPETLSRAAENFATNRDVMEIYVLSLPQGTIHASSQPSAVHQSFESITTQAPLISGSGQIHQPRLHVQGHILWYAMPTLLPNWQGGTRGMEGLIVIELDLTSAIAMLWREISTMLLVGAILLCLTTMLIYALIYLYAYAPLKGIAKVMHRYGKGERGITASTQTTREFAEMAETLNNLLTQQTANEQELAANARQMETATANMEQARNEAQRANQMKGDFLATMSHEIRTPMNGIIGMTDLLLSSQLTGKQAHYARAVQQSAQALLSLINDILDFSKVESGKLDLENVPFNLHDMIESTAELMAVKARDKALELITNVPPALPRYLVGDATRLRQVLINLIGNAIKFTQRGYVLVSLAQGQGSTPEKCVLEIKVQDTGIGIAPDQLERVFDKFTQADASTTRNYGGTGLGLAICRQLTELMGGTLTVASRVGEGSTFSLTLTLPVAVDAEAFEPIEELKGKSILVVDDLPITLTVLEQQLAYAGMEVDVALNGRLAEDLAQRAARRHHPYDVVLIDYLMPVQNGEMIAKQLRALPEYQNTPFVMMSSAESSSLRQRFADAGFAALLPKPFGGGTLYETLLLALGGHPVNLEGATRLNPTSYLGKHILVAEDNRTNREYITTLLEDLGATVHQASNGMEALSVLAETTPQLVFMDCEMPELDGRAATRELRKKHPAHTLPVIALTGHTDAKEQNECLAAGMNACLAKPLRREDLHHALQRWLSPNAPEAHTPLVGKTVLLVEDNRINREYATELLATMGLTVMTADNGLEALRAVPQHPELDLILMDCQMPEMDGYTATQTLRERQAAGELPYIPIIAITANAMKGDKEKCLAVGMDDYLPKPLVKTELVSKLHHWLEKKH